MMRNHCSESQMMVPWSFTQCWGLNSTQFLLGIRIIQGDSHSNPTSLESSIEWGILNTALLKLLEPFGTWVFLQKNDPRSGSVGVWTLLVPRRCNRRSAKMTWGTVWREELPQRSGQWKSHRFYFFPAKWLEIWGDFSTKSSDPDGIICKSADESEELLVN